GGRRLMAMCREAPLKIDPTALIATAIHRQQQFRLLERSVGHPDALLNAYQAREARHHVLFDVAVKQKVRAYLNQARITGRTALQFLQLAGQANRWRHFGIENESLYRTQRMHIARTAWRCRYLPARRMWMEVVPHRSYVEIEQVPANLLARPADDRRGVADERSAVQAEREIAAAPREHDVLIAAEISPFDRGAGCDRDIGRHELVVFDANVDRRRIRRAAHNTNAARHAAAVNAADVVADLVGIGEVELKRPAGIERRAFELAMRHGIGHRMHEQRHFVIDAWCLWVAHDQPAEQASIDVVRNVTNMIVKRPRADHLLRDIEHVGPAFAGQDLVAASTVARCHAERPGSIRFDAVAQAVQVEAVTVTRIGVAHVNAQMLAGPCPDQCAWNTAIPGRFHRIRGNQGRRVGLCVVRIEILAIDNRIQALRQNLIRGNTAELVTLVEHAIAPVAPRAQDRRQWAVVGQRFDLQKNVAG